MKNLILFIAITIGIFINSYAQETIMLNTSKSTLKWSGEYTFYFGGHYGYINFTEGYLIKTKDKITGGSFIIDMNSIVDEDIKDDEGKKGLVDHLKNEDFFNVKEHPTSKLVITKTEYHDSTHLLVHANLTIKGITLPVRFQAEVNFEKKLMSTRFKIDRTLWGITYNSTVKDSAISDAVGFEAELYFY